MPHATEGDLHAYLDGASTAIDPEGARRLSAHLDRCADCAARLEEERAIRGRANDLLAVALPAETPPPFAEIVGAASSRGSSGSRGSPGSPSSQGSRASRWGAERFAWAASLILALGAGWMGHALLRGTDDPLQTAMRAEVETPAEEAGRVGDAAALGRSTAAENEGIASEAQKAAAGAVELEAAVDPEADRPAMQVVGQEAPAARQALREIAAPSTATEAFAELSRLDEAEWRSADLEEATAWAGRAPIVVPELEIVELAVAEAAGERLVRVRQALEDGAVIELIARVGASSDDLRYRADAADAADEARVEAAPARDDELVPAPGAALSDRVAKAVETPTILRRMIAGIPVIAAAALAPDSLAALLSRARTPEP